MAVFQRVSEISLVPEFVVDALHAYLNTKNRDRWWNDSELAMHGCRLKRKEKRRDEAMVFCPRALELAPDSTATLYEVGMFYRETERPNEAIPLLKRATEAGHDQAPAFLAAAYLANREVHSAVKAVRHARRVKPDEPHTWSMSCFIEAAVTIDGMEFALSREEAKKICQKARLMGSEHDVMALFEKHFAKLMFEG